MLGKDKVIREILKQYNEKERLVQNIISEILKEKNHTYSIFYHFNQINKERKRVAFFLDFPVFNKEKKSYIFAITFQFSAPFLSDFFRNIYTLKNHTFKFKLSFYILSEKFLCNLKDKYNIPVFSNFFYIKRELKEYLTPYIIPSYSSFPFISFEFFLTKNIILISDYDNTKTYLYDKKEKISFENFLKKIIREKIDKYIFDLNQKNLELLKTYFEL